MMSEWQLHWLQAEGGLQPWCAKITSEIEATRDLVSSFVTPPRLDILVQRLPKWVIPEIGMVGHAYRRALFCLTVAPDNPNFARSLNDGTLRRQVAHEVHHCLRMGAVGYNQNLGDALVSEGLAGHFVRRLFDTPPELWERAVDAEIAASFFPHETTLTSPTFDYAAWFHGNGGTYPRWLGYTLGYMIVGNWLEGLPDIDGAKFVSVPTAEVLAMRQ
jgi:hypothetical protein